MQVSESLPNCLLIGKLKIDRMERAELNVRNTFLYNAGESGDSVAHGTYGEYPWNFSGSVKDLLKNTCPVFNIEGTDAAGESECLWSQTTSAHTGLPVQWSVIHYNEGLHSLWPRVNTSAEQERYAASLGNFTDALKATGASLVYAT